MPATPLFVIKALAEVDASGLAENMLDRDSVEMLVTDQRAAEWLNSVSDGQYEDALEDMAAAGSDDWMGNEDFPGVEIDPISGLPEHLFRNDDEDSE